MPIPKPRQLNKQPVPAPRTRSAIITGVPDQDQLYINSNIEERRRQEGEEDSIPIEEVYSTSDLYMVMSSPKCPELISNEPINDLPLPPSTVIDGSQFVYTEESVSPLDLEDNAAAPFPLPEKRRSKIRSCEIKQLEITKELNKRFQLSNVVEQDKVHDYDDIDNKSLFKSTQVENKQEIINYEEDDVFQNELPEVPIRTQYPREDMSRIKTAIIFSDSPSFNFTNTLPPTPMRSMSLTDTKSKTGTLKKLKKIGKSLSSESYLPKQRSKSGGNSNSEMFKRPNFIGDLDSSVKHAGMLVIDHKDRDEVRVMINNGCMTWNGEKGEKSINIMHVTSLTAVNVNK